MTISSAADSNSWRRLIDPGIRAVRKNWPPVLMMQAIGLLIVVGYYRVDAIREIARHISDAKQSGGELFVIAAGAIAGGFLPIVAKALTGRLGRLTKTVLIDAAYAGFVFAVLAVEVDAFYRVQVVVFGDGIDPLTLIKKTALDMFVVAPTIFSPVVLFLIHARQVGFKGSPIREAFSWAFYRDRILPTLPLNWAFWIPMVLCVYALPTTLQFPMAQLAEGCWSILLVFMAYESAPSAH